MTDVVQKLDAWLKSHNEGAAVDYIEDAISDLVGLREDLEKIAEPMPAHVHDTFCNFGIGCLSGKSLLDIAWCLNKVCEQLELAANARERAS